MTNTATYTTEVTWKGEHLGRVVMGNGPEMDFSAPPDAYGLAGVLTPEDAFVAAANTCIMMMFLWACERFKLDLVSYRCRGEGTKRVEIDRTETFTYLRFWPEIVVRAAPGEDLARTEGRIRKALASAQKYSLVANSVKSEIMVDPAIVLLGHEDTARGRTTNDE
jgi:organic hydroperoxide reductase OsmC/OhrA